MSFPSDQRSTSITTRVFAVRRKGFDPDEVRAYLGQLAEVVSRLTVERDQARGRIGDLEAAAAARPAVDEDQLTAVLGEETARVLSSARKAALEMRQRAEENGARLLREAAEEAVAVRRSAATDAARLREEAEVQAQAQKVAAQVERDQAEADREAIGARAEAEAAERQAQADEADRQRRAEAEAEAEVLRAGAQAEAQAAIAAAEEEAAAIRTQGAGDRDAARDEGREMVAEARRVRERMLGDLARRRKAARAQLDQLQTARDRLLESYEAIQRTIDEATAGLHAALPEARHAAEVARLRAESEPEVSVDQLEAQITAARSAGLPLITSDGGDRPAADDRTDLPGDARSGGLGDVGSGRASPPAEEADDHPSEVEHALLEALPELGSDGPADVAAGGPPVAPVPAPEPPDPQSERPGPTPTRADPPAALRDEWGLAVSEVAPAVVTPEAVEPAAVQPTVVPRQTVGAETIEPASILPASILPADVEPADVEAEKSEPDTTEPETAPAESAAGGRSTSRSAEPGPPPGSETTAWGTSGPEPALLDLTASETTQSATDAPGTAESARPFEPEPVEPAQPVESGTVEPETATAEAELGTAGSAPSDEPSEPVDDLFARLRASQQASVARARALLDEPDPPADPGPDPGSPSAAGPDSSTGGADPAAGTEGSPLESADDTGSANGPADLASLLERRDGAIEPIENRIARRLKRVLADEQGRVLDGVRRSRRTPPLADVLPLDEQVAAYASAVSEDLLAAAEEGAGFAGAALPAGTSVDAVAAELARSLAGVVRPRVERCFESGEDTEDTSDRLRATYREWKTDRLVEATRHLVLSAFGLGQAAVTPAGAPVRWVNDPSVTACPDCEDDALAGTLRSGEPFPTGHAWPPAHPGCRCLVLAERVATPA